MMDLVSKTQSGHVEHIERNERNERVENRQTTATDEPDNYKYHLTEYPWTFSFKPKIAYKQQSERDWLSDYKTIYEIKDIERFWQVYNNIPCFTDMPSGSIYAMFRNSIHPSWEHEENKKGFSWIFYINKYTNKEWIKKLYEYSLLTLIGCTYAYEEKLNGCTFEKKARGDKFVYWFKDGEDTWDMLQKLTKEINVNIEECKVCEDGSKIDWKLPEFKNVKAAIKIVRHDDSTIYKTHGDRGEHGDHGNRKNRSAQRDNSDHRRGSNRDNRDNRRKDNRGRRSNSKHTHKRNYSSNRDSKPKDFGRIRKD